mmetsp:Transcript_16457/g.35575  ORF Transcript_16457/g.35575 Transcript_16457/m.35575 type:complete len:212 (-) Transcript_16457:127-762(-)|eukprot:CAMPEP_0202901624 /NCGR_PEP_ID=MMETSP1392-20130828/14363_1 /ASSEMBLY_ACC=CAM_ASM_000868 /TAXON_ID=225041 /ORGANISM="Chlamydomonas chlamydogama, Strain SAG 11-48b" /LENGTH=211 /DNA_ID=CAMNT_0049588213 /DNA_START=160 /DNA_END=795 /DNA_ORIENTATION=+
MASPVIVVIWNTLSAVLLLVPAAFVGLAFASFSVQDALGLNQVIGAVCVFLSALTALQPSLAIAAAVQIPRILETAPPGHKERLYNQIVDEPEPVSTLGQQNHLATLPRPFTSSAPGNSLNHSVATGSSWLRSPGPLCRAAAGCSILQLALLLASVYLDLWASYPQVIYYGLPPAAALVVAHAVCSLQVVNSLLPSGPHMPEDEGGAYATL